jgi:hypothetical protein
MVNLERQNIPCKNSLCVIKEKCSKEESDKDYIDRLKSIAEKQQRAMEILAATGVILNCPKLEPSSCKTCCDDNFYRTWEQELIKERIQKALKQVEEANGKDL